MHGVLRKRESQSEWVRNTRWRMFESAKSVLIYLRLSTYIIEWNILGLNVYAVETYYSYLIIVVINKLVSHV